MNEELKVYLQKIANVKLLTENMGPDDDICSWCGGNFDDVYEIGVEDGTIHLARQLLQKFNKD